jgi:hypothetical protein
MELKILAELERTAETTTIPRTRTERLQRWAAALAKLGSARLSSLLRTEYVAPEALAQVRAENSPLSVAAEDPVLRIAGLNNDTFGEAMRFFELSDHELHRIVCYCHYGETMSAEEAAHRVRAMASAGRLEPGFGW